MAGLINSAPAPVQAPQKAALLAPTGNIPAMSDPILKQAEAALEAKVPPALKPDYQKIVIAGMQILFNPKTHGMMVATLKRSPDIAANVSTIASGTVTIIYSQAKSAPEFNAQTFGQAGMLAAETLMMQVLDFAEKSKMIQVTSDLLEKCTLATKDAYLAKCRVSPQQQQQIMAQAQAKQGAPAAPPQAPLAQPQPMGA